MREIGITIIETDEKTISVRAIDHSNGKILFDYRATEQPQKFNFYYLNGAYSCEFFGGGAVREPKK